MKRLAGSPALRLLATLTVAALVWLGSVHRHGPAPDPSLAAFLQAGGSLADLCHAGGHAPHQPADECPACTLAKSVAMGPAGTLVVGPRPAMGSAPPCRAAVRGVTRGPRPPPARGPPALA